MQDDHLALYVTDTGHGIEVPESADRPAVDAIGGRGIWLSRQLADEVDIDTGPDGTRVRPAMKLSRPNQLLTIYLDRGQAPYAVDLPTGVTGPGCWSRRGAPHRTNDP